MKKGLLALCAIFTVLTFAGAGYVLVSKGAANAGYAVVPMLVTLVLLAVYQGKYRKQA